MENKNEVMEIKIPLKEILKGKDGELVVLQDYQQTEEILKGIAEKYKDIVISNDSFEIGKSIRKEIREYRYAIQNIQKHNTGILNDAKKIDKERHDNLIKIIQPVEDKLDEQIKFIEGEKERIKAEELELENQRIHSHKIRLIEFETKFEKLVTFGKTEEDKNTFDHAISELKNLVPMLEEFGGDAEIIIANYSSSAYLIAERISDAKKQEEEKIAIQKQKEELDAKEKEFAEWKLEKEAKEKELEEREAKLKESEKPKEEECKIVLEAEFILKPIEFNYDEEDVNVPKEIVLEKQDISDISFEDFDNCEKSFVDKEIKFCEEFKDVNIFKICNQTKVIINDFEEYLSMYSDVNLESIDKTTRARLCLFVEGVTVLLTSLKKDFKL